MTLISRSGLPTIHSAKTSLPTLLSRRPTSAQNTSSSRPIPAAASAGREGLTTTDSPCLTHHLMRS